MTGLPRKYQSVHRVSSRRRALWIEPVAPGKQPNERVDKDAHLRRQMLTVRIDRRDREHWAGVVPQQGHEGTGLKLLIDSLMVRRLADWRHVLCCSPSYLETHPEPASPADLSAHNCIRDAFSPFGDEWRFTNPDGGPLAVRVAGNLVTSVAKTKGGIIIPDTVKEKPQEGEVVAVGPGARDESGKLSRPSNSTRANASCSASGRARKSRSTARSS
jgi:DNA-binding transcriptional LysR family regulator